MCGACLCSCSYICTCAYHNMCEDQRTTSNMNPHFLLFLAQDFLSPALDFRLVDPTSLLDFYPHILSHGRKHWNCRGVTSNFVQVLGIQIQSSDFPSMCLAHGFDSLDDMSETSGEETGSAVECSALDSTQLYTYSVTESVVMCLGLARHQAG